MLDNYTKKCKITKGGIKRVYLLPYVKYSRSLIKDSEMSLIEFPDSYIYQFDCVGNYTQTSNTEEGSVFFDQTINIQLSEVYNVLDANLFLQKDFRVIAETNNNDLIMFGIYNGMECKLSNNSGSSKSEFNGFNLDFTGKEEKTGLLIDSLESLNLYIFNPSEVFNYDFNFNI